MAYHRKITKGVSVGNLTIGAGERILIQSMTNTPTQNFEDTIRQIRMLEAEGCDIVRVTVPDYESVRNLSRLKENCRIPIVADIHFDHRLAIESAFAGADKIRINPGNIGGEENVKAVVAACKEKKIPIRIGVNSGSLEKKLLVQFGGVTPEALCMSAMDQIRLMERLDFDQLVISVKSSSVPMMIETNRLLSAQCDYPLHLGVTEAGTLMSGVVKSSVGIGTLLSEGIGDTVRVSLTTKDLAEEVRAARRILDACSLTDTGIDVVSCPTCGRTKIDLVGIAEELENRLSVSGLKPKRKIKVAVMGCIVNGPGEAREADVGIAGGRSDALLFRRGEIVCKINEGDVLDVLMTEIKKIVEEEE